MGRRHLLKGQSGPLLSTYRAILFGMAPVFMLVICFELFVPDSLLADRVALTNNLKEIELSRYVLFITVGAIHILVCMMITALSVLTIMSRTSAIQARKTIGLAVVVPSIAISLAFVIACALDLKIYRVSYGRVIHLLSQTADFSYQFSTCSHASWLRVFCASGNFHLTVFAFVLIIFGIVALFSQHDVIGSQAPPMTIIERLAIVSHSFVTYLIKVILPINMASIYPYPAELGKVLPFQYLKIFFVLCE